MMRIFFLVTFVANIVLTLVSWVILPDTVAIHFRHDGMPDGWSPVWFHVLIFLGMQLVLFVTIYFGSRLSLGLHSRWANLPNKNYWLREENLPKAQEMVQIDDDGVRHRHDALSLRRRHPDAQSQPLRPRQAEQRVLLAELRPVHGLRGLLVREAPLPVSGATRRELLTPRSTIGCPKPPRQASLNDSWRSLRERRHKLQRHSTHDLSENEATILGG